MKYLMVVIFTVAFTAVAVEYTTPQQDPVTSEEIYNLISNYTYIYQDDSLMRINITNPYTKDVIRAEITNVDTITVDYSNSSGVSEEYRVYYIIG